MLVLLAQIAGQLTRMVEEHLRGLGPQTRLVTFDHDQLQLQGRRPHGLRHQPRVS